MVPVCNPLSSIDGVFNGILVGANMVGDVMFYGPGAGKLPTASAVVADIIDIISNRDTSVKPIAWEAATDADMADFNDYVCRRLFIVKDVSVLPEQLLKEATVREADGVCGVLLNAMTEAETDALSAKFGDAVLSVYRVLD